MGFDQISPFYTRYRVPSSKISVMWNPSGVANINRYNIRVFTLDTNGIGAVTALDLNGLRESGQGGNIGVLGQWDENVIQHHSHCEASYSERKHFGKDSDVDTSSLTSANPLTGQIYYLIALFPTSTGIASAAAQQFRVRIEYSARFTERITLLGS